MKFLIKFAYLKGVEVVEGEDIVWASDVRHALLLTEPDHDFLGAVVESVTPLEDDAQVEPDWEAVSWRQLKKGERVEKGDWVDMARDGWRDDPKWVPATKIGELAPDPCYPAHRTFRRIL